MDLPNDGKSYTGLGRKTVNKKTNFRGLLASEASKAGPEVSGLRGQKVSIFGPSSGTPATEALPRSLPASDFL